MRCSKRRPLRSIDVDSDALFVAATPMSQSMNLNSIAVIIFNSTASHAAARLQRRFRLLSCRRDYASELPFGATATGLCIAAVWGVSNDEGTALEKKMLAALNLVLGDETGAQPGSVRGDCPAGTVIAGPLMDAKLVKQLQLVPPDPPPEPADEPPAAPTKPSSSKSDDIDYGPKPSELLRGPMKGEKAPSLGASVPPGQSPQILNLTIDRTKDGIDLQIVRIQPPADGGKAAGGDKAAAKGDDTRRRRRRRVERARRAPHHHQARGGQAQTATAGGCGRFAASRAGGGHNHYTNYGGRFQVRAELSLDVCKRGAARPCFATP